jgi:hypothetical protein
LDPLILFKKSKNSLKERKRKMTNTIVSLYEDFATARRVAQDLVDAGFSRDHISVMSNDATGEYSSQMRTEFDSESDVGGAAIGLMLPISQKEDELMGEARDRLLHQAQDKAKETLKMVEEGAGEAHRATAEAVQENQSQQQEAPFSTSF